MESQADLLIKEVVEFLDLGTITEVDFGGGFEEVYENSVAQVMKLREKLTTYLEGVK